MQWYSKFLASIDTYIHIYKYETYSVWSRGDEAREEAKQRKLVVVGPLRDASTLVGSATS